MSAPISNVRPAPDKVLSDIADYATKYELRSADAYETARYCLMDTLGCGFEALEYPACTKLLGPIVQGTVVPNGGGFQNRWFASGGRVVSAKVLSRFVSQTLRTFIVSPKQENLVVLSELIEAGKVTPVIDRTYPLSETAQAIDHVGGGHARGKVVINV